MCGSSVDSIKRHAHFDLSMAKKLKQQQQQHNQQQSNNRKKTNSANLPESDENYLILFLQDLMRIACIGATSNCDPQKLVGLDLLHDLILNFASVEEPNPEFKGHLILEQYQAQVSAALRPQFSVETSAHVTAKACQVCSMWISSGVARDLNDLRRVHQLLVSSLQKLTANIGSYTSLVDSGLSGGVGSVDGGSGSTVTGNESLIYSELSLTVEKLAVLRAWAEVYIVAQRKAVVEKKQRANALESANKSDRTVRNQSIDICDGWGGNESLLSLVKPELSILSHHWSIALKDYAFLCLPNGTYFLLVDYSRDTLY